MARLIGCVVRLVWPVVFFATSAGGAAIDKDLDGIRKKIEKEKRGITQVQKKEGSLLQALGKIEGDLEKKNHALGRADEKLKVVVREMRKKESAAERNARLLRQRQDLLKRRALALYRWQRGGSPFVVLNGDLSPGALLQRRHYLQTTLAFDRDLIRALSEEAARQDTLKHELARKKSELDTQKRALAEVKQSAEREAEKKRELLASLRQEKESRVRSLKELEQAARRLQTMLDEMAKKSVATPEQPAPGTGLEATRGKLDWPVKGEVMRSFGKARHPEFSAEVFRKGIEIEAPVGEPIKAVEKGKIVFADRFSGYGKLVIIDHGERFYTVYAHLSEFLKQKGDLVKRGESIGLAGASDSMAGAKLYFEVRKDGRSIDPLPWLRRP
jgi:septal ring factor EnvC (AmiA/AmiB activator)